MDGRNKKIIRLCKINFVTENLKLHTTNRVKIIDEENKQEGIYLLSPDGKLQKQMEGNYSLQLLKQSVNGKYILFQRQNYNEYRNLWWSRSDFKHPQKLTDANPQQKTYNWGTVRLLQWTNDEGKENKGLLYLPENYNPSYSYLCLYSFTKPIPKIFLFIIHRVPVQLWQIFPPLSAKDISFLCPIFILLLVTPERVATIPLSAE